MHSDASDKMVSIAGPALGCGSEWCHFHRWPLAVIWLWRQSDGKIHVVPFEICSCVMPTRAEWSEYQNPLMLLLSHLHIHKHRYALIFGPPDPVFYCDVIDPALLSLKMNAKPSESSLNARLSCFITPPAPYAQYDWIHLVKCHRAPTEMLVR